MFVDASLWQNVDRPINNKYARLGWTIDDFSATTTTSSYNVTALGFDPVHIARLNSPIPEVAINGLMDAMACDSFERYFDMSGTRPKEFVDVA